MSTVSLSFSATTISPQTVIVCIGDQRIASIATALRDAEAHTGYGDVLYISADSHTSLSEIAVALATVPGSVALLLGPTATEHAAALGAARRAARKPVRQYLLVDPGVLPSTRIGDYDWPDAPVTLLISEPSRVAEAAALRGWRVFNVSEDEHTPEGEFTTTFALAARVPDLLN